MKIVLDTNCFISCVGKKSPYRHVFDVFLDKKYTLCVSSDIVLEYEEKFLQFWGHEVATNLLGTLLTASNVGFHGIFYSFLLVTGDADDNKFADAFIASNANYLVTNDRHLLAIRNNPFPPMHILTIQEFMDLIG